MSFTDILYSLLPYIIAVVVIFIGWKIYKSYTSDTPIVQEKIPDKSEEPVKLASKEDDLCIKCNAGTLQIYDTDDSINLACNSCSTLYMQWPLVK